MKRRYRYGFEPTTQFEFVQITSENSDNYCPNYHDLWKVVGYMKGQNGHYLLIDKKYGDYEVARLYTRNQLRESNYCGRFSIDRSHLTNPMDAAVVTKFRNLVMTHVPYHHVAKVRDVQRASCYRWEADFGLDTIGTDMDLGRSDIEKARNYVNIICKLEDVKAPAIKFSTKGSCSWAKGGHTIKLLTESSTVSNKTLIHELAHVVDFIRNRSVKANAEAGHGPSFIGIYIDFLVKYGKIDRTFLEQKARKHGLEWTYENCKKA